MSRKVSLAGVCLGVLLALVACGPKTATLKIDMQEFKFVPDHWFVPAEAQVTVTLNNAGALDHTWIIMKKGVTATTPFANQDASTIFWKAQVPAGQQQTFTFVAPADPGDYEVVCGESGHLEQGMKGTLTVQ